MFYDKGDTKMDTSKKVTPGSSKSNCHTFGRFGPVSEGIELITSDKFGTQLMVGAYHVGPDKYNGCPVSTVGNAKVVKRAFALQRLPKDKKPFYTLRHAGEGVLRHSLVKVFYGMPMRGCVKVNGYELNIHAGVSGTVKTVLEFGQDVLVEFLEGQEMHIFFPDGAVRFLKQEGVYLKETELSHKQMLGVRIKNAKERLAVARLEENEELRTKKVKSILSGMADLVYVMQGEKAQDLRIMLIRETFLSLSTSERDLVRPKLWAILSTVDCVVRNMLTEDKQQADLSLLKEKYHVTDISDARKRRAATLAAKAAADAELRAKMKGKSGGKQNNTASNPKTIAKRERKLSQRKK